MRVAPSGAVDKGSRHGGARARSNMPVENQVTRTRGPWRGVAARL